MADEGDVRLGAERHEVPGVLQALGGIAIERHVAAHEIDGGAQRGLAPGDEGEGGLDGDGDAEVPAKAPHDGAAGDGAEGGDVEGGGMSEGPVEGEAAA